MTLGAESVPARAPPPVPSEREIGVGVAAGRLEARVRAGEAGGRAWTERVPGV